MPKLTTTLMTFTLGAAMAGCTTLGEVNDLTAQEKTELLANYDADPETRVIGRFCISPDWPVVFGSTFTEAVYDARFSYVKRVGRNNGYLIEYSRSCDDLTRGGRVGNAVAVDCRGDIIRVRGASCRVDEIYNVENETDARRLALKIQVERAESQPPSDLPDQEVAGRASVDVMSLP